MLLGAVPAPSDGEATALGAGTNRTEQKTFMQIEPSSLIKI